MRLGSGPPIEKALALYRVLDVLDRETFYFRMIDVHLKDIHAGVLSGVRVRVAHGGQGEHQLRSKSDQDNHENSDGVTGAPECQASVSHGKLLLLMLS
jgi:hypothetical protein